MSLVERLAPIAAPPAPATPPERAVIEDVSLASIETAPEPVTLPPETCASTVRLVSLRETAPPSAKAPAPAPPTVSTSMVLVADAVIETELLVEETVPPDT